MSEIISVISSPFNLVTKLHEIIQKYLKKRRTEHRFVSAFENETRMYISICKEIYEHSESQMLPILESIGEELTVSNMNELLEGMSRFPLLHARLIEVFVSFARACSEVSAIKGFMDDLKESNIVLFDFVHTMKNAYAGQDRVKINGRYYRFFKTYEDEIFREVEASELKEAVEELKCYASKIKEYMIRTALIRRKIRKKFSKNMRVFAKAAEKMTVEPTATIDLRAYIPEKLLPITVLIEEF